MLCYIFNPSNETEILKMNPTCRTPGKYIPYKEATHKPIVSLFIDGDDRYFKCSDGGLTMYGRTHTEAFNNLKRLR